MNKTTRESERSPECSFFSIFSFILSAHTLCKIQSLCLASRIVLHRGEAALRKHLREHNQKAALSSEIRKSRNRPPILAKTGLRVGFESAT